jgi:hypothetical protein
VNETAGQYDVPIDPYWQAEEDRAALWRDQTQQRIAYQLNLWWSFMAPTQPRLDLMTRWSPILYAEAENAAGPIDPMTDP